jgi:glycerol-3-phosphate acyltransferase PlsY
MTASFVPIGAALACALLSYLAGSIPFGLILTKAKGHGDIRALGSGNIGATNVLRTGDKKLAFATLLCDAVKGYVPVVIAARYAPDMAAIAVIFAVLGHIFPVWLGFRGGKGVATGCGALLAYLWPAALAVIATWLVIAAAFRYSSLAALVAAASAPLWTWLFAATPEQPLVAVFLALIVIARHRGNITRLLRGEEGKISGTKKRA